MISHRYFVNNLENLLILTIVHFGILSIVKKCPAKKEYWAFPVRSSGAGKCFRIRFAFDLVSEILGYLPTYLWEMFSEQMLSSCFRDTGHPYLSLGEVMLERL